MFFSKKLSILRTDINFLQTKLIYNSDAQSRIKFKIRTPVKLTIRNFIPDPWSFPTDNKG